jgi:hypothetical protein
MRDKRNVAFGGMRIGAGNRNARRKSAAVTLCSPQIPHDLTWDGTWAAAVRHRERNRLSYCMTLSLLCSNICRIILLEKACVFHILRQMGLGRLTDYSFQIPAYYNLFHVTMVLAISCEPSGFGEILNQMYDSQLLTDFI